MNHMLLSASERKRLHEEEISSGKRAKYPRPTEKCTGCEDMAILCYGNKLQDAYWRHATNSKCNYTSELIKRGGEGSVHKEAKDLMASFLSGNDFLSVRYRCNLCFNTGSIEFDISKCKVSKEVSMSLNGRCCIWDIALHKNQRIFFGVEIKDTHSPEDCMIRDSVKWIELEATDVIRILKTNTSAPVFTDVRQKCFDKDACLEKIKAMKEKKKIEEEEIRVAFQRNLEEKKVVEEKIKAEEAELETSRHRELTLQREHRLIADETAKRMGILVKYDRGNEVWYPVRSNGYSQSYEIFFGLKKCIKCLCPHESSLLIPFCAECRVEVSMIYEIKENAKKLGYLVKTQKGWRYVARSDKKLSWGDFKDVCDKKKCIRCRKGWLIEPWKPYCIDCYKELVD